MCKNARSHEEENKTNHLFCHKCAVISTCRRTPAAHCVVRDLDLWSFDVRVNLPWTLVETARAVFLLAFNSTRTPKRVRYFDQQSDS